jgi:DNA-binding NarL/FixJ family response regulator
MEARDMAPPGHINRVRVFLIDDHPLFCDGIQALFEREPTFEFVGQTGHPATALAMVRHYQPDIILLDIELPGANGLDLVNQLRRIAPAVKIAVLTAYQEQQYLQSALRLDVEAFLRKDLTGSAILDALWRVLNGERVIGDPQAQTEALKDYGRLMRERERDQSGLTEQEIEILRLAASGLNNKEIGDRLFWSEITVKRKMRDIYHKLDVGSRAQAVAKAINLGFI